MWKQCTYTTVNWDQTPLQWKLGRYSGENADISILMLISACHILLGGKKVDMNFMMAFFRDHICQEKVWAEIKTSSDYFWTAYYQVIL